ncbi:hypothetical protein [Helicobacter cappadocius]|uniref:Uncharacterized protein n=1 Tax=Helicobacter cappadocius TaxID=3063998 RepID=A0AA90PK41_9HELI|nr:MULTISPECIES: hypothetical protein [unclassified Helicobacter]MDO7253459.1 hypothetical protein [Helicobacter sp. faydin-H75]MDP2539386.1 hypothetical protein [Helicobacter sp. faydin-H76]
MNSTYNLIINASFTDVDRVIGALPDIFKTDQDMLDNISLVLFEILSNALEHGICKYSKNEIFSGLVKKSSQKIYLYFLSSPNPIILINYPKTVYNEENLIIGKGKKIIKYLTQNYYYKILGEEVWEKVIFKGQKNENHRQ